MKILLGNKIRVIDPIELNKLISGYKAVIIDLGTGEGEFVYRQARKNNDAMYIGIDLSADQMRHYSMKACKRKEKGGLENVLYIVDDVNDISDDLKSIADRLFIHFPWGSLLDGIIKGECRLLDCIARLSKKNAILEIFISYNDLYEKKEMDSRHLPILSAEYLNICLKDIYRSHGIEITGIVILDNREALKIDTKWAKKLAYGRKRDIYHIKCKIKN